jgi:hypothetical protein
MKCNETIRLNGTTLEEQVVFDQWKLTMMTMILKTFLKK